MKILSPERTRRALWFTYARLTSSPLHTAYTVSLLLTSLTLLTLHLVSLSTTHASISKLSTLLSLARPENSPVIIPTVSSQDGQPVLQLCNVGQSNCQVISSVAPSATATSTPEPIEPQAASPSPATTAQESNAQITPVADVGVQGNGVVSVSVSQSSTSTGVIIAAPPATTSTLISSSSSTGLFIAEVPLPTTAVKEGTEPSLLTAPTLVLNTPTVTSTSISTEATLNITSTSSETLRETSTSTLSTTTTTAESTTTTTESTTTREINAETTSTSESIATYTSSETLQETSTSELSTSTSLIAQSTASETANSTSTSALADATPNEISASTTQSLPPLPTAQLTTANETSTTSQTATSAVESIQVIAPGTPSTLQLPRRGALRRRAFSATAVVDGANGAVSGIDVTDVQDVGGSEVTRLGVVCALAMAFPELQLRQSWMEDIVLVVFYLWLAAIGVAALITESTSHLVAVFLSSLVALLWSGTQLLRTRALRSQFDAFITRGACSGVDVLPFYWTQRERLELPTLVINCLTVLVLGGISFHLAKTYRKTSVVNRYVYKVILVLRIAILMGMFFLGAATVLWVQQLFSPTVTTATTLGALKGLGIVSLVLAVPLGAMGWWALRIETRSSGSRSLSRWAMGFFLVLDLVFVAQWTTAFASDVYRDAFMRWTFFAALSVGGFFLLVGSLGAGVICWMRFGKVLPSIPVFEKTVSESGNLGDGFDAVLQREGLPWEYSTTAEKAWEPFDRISVRQSQFTSSDRQSVAFSYGLRSPAPPIPRLDSRSNSVVSS